MTLSYNINSLAVNEHQFETVKRENNVIRQLTGLPTLFQLHIKPLIADTEYQFYITTDLILLSLYAFYPKSPGGDIKITQLDSNMQVLRTITITAIQGEFDNTVDVGFLPYVLNKDSFLRVSTSIACNEVLIMADPVLVQNYLQGEKIA